MYCEAPFSETKNQEPKWVICLFLMAPYLTRAALYFNEPRPWITLQFSYWQRFKNLKKVKESLPFCTLAADVQTRKSLLNDDVVLQHYEPQRLGFYEDTGTVFGFFFCCSQALEKDVCVHSSSIISLCCGRLVSGYTNLIYSHSSK